MLQFGWGQPGDMPIYKISKRGEEGRRERLIHGRVRLVMLLVSGLLLLATAALLCNHLAHHSV